MLNLFLEIFALEEKKDNSQESFIIAKPHNYWCLIEQDFYVICLIIIYISFLLFLFFTWTPSSKINSSSVDYIFSSYDSDGKFHLFKKIKIFIQVIFVRTKKNTPISFLQILLILMIRGIKVFAFQNVPTPQSKLLLVLLTVNITAM